MTAPGTLDFCGLTFSSGSGSRGLYLGDLPGWDVTPAAKEGSESRPRAHGSFRRRVAYRESRVFSVEGSFSGNSIAEAKLMRQQLNAMQSDGQASPLIYHDPDLGERTVIAQVISGPEMPTRLFSPFFKFAFEVSCADPLKYGPQTTSTTGPPVSGGGLVWPLTWPITWAAGGSDGRLIISNDGEADTTSTFVATGGASGGVSIAEVGTGREIRLERLIPASSQVTFETRTGRVWIDDPGNDVSGFLTRSDWFSIPAHGQSIVQFNTIGDVSGSPSLTHRTPPAYW